MIQAISGNASSPSLVEVEIINDKQNRTSGVRVAVCCSDSGWRSKKLKTPGKC